MEKKLLICGSAVAVVVLVLAGLNPVVGFHTVKSSVRDSPLFSVRSKRAIDEETDAMTCEYIGKGKPTLITITKRDNRMELVQRVIDIISKMDDKAFKRFVELVYRHIRKYDKNANVKEILQSIKYNSDRTKNDIVYNPNADDELTVDIWFPGCTVLSILIFFVVIAFLFVYGLIFGFESWDPYCTMHHCI